MAAEHNKLYTSVVRMLSSTDIDTTRYIAVLDAANAPIYAYPWYMDALNIPWSVLVLNDYDAVMPLMVKKKAAWQYLSMPLLVQKWGLFAANELSDKDISACAGFLKGSFFLIDYRAVDDANNVAFSQHFKVHKRVNYILDLSVGMGTIRKAYNSQTRRNLKTAQEAGLEVRFDIQPAALIDLYRTYIAPKDKKVPMTFYQALPIYMNSLLELDRGQVAGAYKNGILHAAAFFIRDTNSIINIFPASHPDGRNTQAMTLLLDTVFEKNAGQPVVFDFEGSMIENIARFYRGFGAISQPYSGILYNRLPWWMRIAKGITAHNGHNG